MQAELSRLEEQLAKTLWGKAWHGPSVLETLEGVSAEQAAAHPIKGAHSIWELVLHLSGCYGLVLRRLDGDGRQLSESEDWPPVPEPPYTAYTQFIGVTQHNLYHAGQIALLKKALGAER